MTNFNDLIKSRTSVRAYKAEVPTKEVLTQVMEAARLAPSAVNFQPWQFLVVSDEAWMSRLHKCYHRDWFDSAPACIVVLGNHQQSWHRQADGKDHCDIDASIAIDHLTLQATELGLGTCWVCNFEVEKVVQLFDLPDHLEPVALVPIGYPEEDEVLLPKEKKRKLMNEIVKWY